MEIAEGLPKPSYKTRTQSESVVEWMKAGLNLKTPGSSTPGNKIMVDIFLTSA